MHDTTKPDLPSPRPSLVRKPPLVAALAVALVGAVVLGSYSALAAPTPAPAVPHTFTANTPARADEVNANFRFVARGMIPAGGIIMWSGSVSDIPEGWALCDGTNGTPDLRSRFIVGAGPGGIPTYAPHDNGEPDVHHHFVPVPEKTVTTSKDGKHTHKFPASWYDRELANGTKSSIDTGGQDPQKQTTQADGEHSHTVTLPGATLTSAASSGHNRPKWYALAFIMKLPY